MRIFTKQNNKDATIPKNTQQSDMTSVHPVTSAVPKPEISSEMRRNEHLLPSFQMHQFYINRPLVDDEDTLVDLPPPPPPPPIPSVDLANEDAVSLRSSDSVVPELTCRRSARGSSHRSRISSNHTRALSTGSGGSALSHELTEEQRLHNLFYHNINFDSEKESMLHNLNLLNHLQNKFIKMKIYVAKTEKVHPTFRQVTDDFSVREFQQGDEINGFATITNNSKAPLKFEMFSTFLYGEITVVRAVGEKYRHVFLKMIDLESSLLSDTEEVDTDGYIKGLPKSKILSPSKSYKVPFSFVLPDNLLDNVCENELSTHLRLPPSFGISKDSSGWFGNIPDKGYVCHDLSTLHSNTTQYGNYAYNDKLDENNYLKGGDGIFTTDLCPNGVAISYGVNSVLIESSKASKNSNFAIVNDVKHQLRVVPHYTDKPTVDSFASLTACKDNYYSLESLRSRFELEITRLENLIDQCLGSSKESSDEERPCRKLRSVTKEKQLELAEWNRKLKAKETLATWDSVSAFSSPSSGAKQAELKRKEYKSAQKRYLGQQLKSFDNNVCSIVNFLGKSANNDIVNEINSINKANPTLFILDKLNHRFIESYSRSSFLKISCPSIDFDLNYKTPLDFKIGKTKTIWKMFSERKRSSSKVSTDEDYMLSNNSSNAMFGAVSSEPQNLQDSTHKLIELDLEFVSIKAGSPFSDYNQKPPKIKSTKINLCVLTVDSKNPIPISLRADMFLNATNENVDLNNSENFADSSRKVFSFAKHNSTGVVSEFRNYKHRLLKISKDLDLINHQRKEGEQEVNINPNVVKSLNSLLTLRFSKTVIDEEYEIKSHNLANQKWNINQIKIEDQTRLVFKNKLSIIFDTDNQSIKETLLPSFQNCLIARIYCFKVELEFEDNDDDGPRGYNKKKAVIFIPIEIK